MSMALVMKRSVIGDETDNETVCWLIRQAPMRCENVKIWQFIIATPCPGLLRAQQGNHQEPVFPFAYT